MSTMIHATTYNDPLIQTIRNQVTAKSDGVPYLLFPVKIETRFMEVERSVRDKPDLYAEVLDSSFALEEYLRFDPGPLPNHEVLGRMRKLPGMVHEINVKTDGIQHLSSKDRDRLVSELVQIEKVHEQLSIKLSLLPWTDKMELRRLMEHKQNLSKSLQQTREKIDALIPSDKTLSQESEVFLHALEEVNDSLSDVGKKKLSGRDRKEKRAQSAYLDTRFSNIGRAMLSAKKCMNCSMQGTPTQIKKLDTLQKGQEKLLTTARKNIATLKSDYKKAEYLEKVEQVREKIENLQHEIKRRVRPKMVMQYDLKTTNARELLWQVNKIRYRLKRINPRPFHTYDELKNTRQSLYKQLDVLRTDTSYIIEGNDEELQALSKAWDDTDVELERFSQRVKSFKGLKGQKSAISRTVTHINDTYRKDLQGLKSTSKSYVTELNNKSLEKSAVNFAHSLNALQEIWGELCDGEMKPGSKKLKTCLKKLVDFQGEFEAASHDIHVLPANALKELQQVAGKITNELEKRVASSDRDTKRRKKERTLNVAARAAAAVESIARDQVSDTQERRETLSEENRTPFVFARNTVTRNELWVRFYPDDIAIHSHEEALTREEVAAGKAYWYEVWAANEDYETKLAAWRAISTGYGSQRAAWIVRSLKPKEVDPGDNPDKLRLNSKAMIEVIDLLGKVVDFLKQGVDLKGLVVAMGKAYPLLARVEENLGAITENHVNLMLKTQKLLLKLQSIVNGVIRMIDGIAPEERLKVEKELGVVNQFVTSFKQVMVDFQQIKKLSSKEIIKKEGDFLRFPDVELKEDSWSVAPHSNVMPDRFVVVTVRNGAYKHVVVGNQLPEDRLIVGLDPSTFQTDGFAYDVDGNLIVDESIKWLTDFDEAVQKGMAVHINLDEEDLSEGFEKVFVVGVKDTTIQEGKQLLEQLLDNHHYIPEGASFLPIGTPTNNTEAGESGYRTFEEDASLSFAIERNNEEERTTSSILGLPSDSERLAEGLGIDIDVLNNLDYHDRTEISEALLMNKALFHGTLGNYMEEGLDTLSTLGTIDRTKAFFCNYVSARGFLPTLRIGTQPYGILPTTAFSWLNVTDNDSFIPVLNKEDFDRPDLIEPELQTRYDIRLKNLLNPARQFVDIHTH